MTHQEAGRRGGIATLERHGPEQMKQWGAKGGRPRHPTLAQIQNQRLSNIKNKRMEVVQRQGKDSLKKLLALYRLQVEEMQLIKNCGGVSLGLTPSQKGDKNGITD